MSNVAYCSGWKSEMCVQLYASHNLLADFNRFLVKGFPATQKLQHGGQFENANRESFIHKLKLRFDDEISEGGSHSSLYSIFSGTALYLRWCDEQDQIAFTKASLENYMLHLQAKVTLGKLKKSTYKSKHSQMTTLFTRYLELPSHYFDDVTIMDNSDSEPFEAYTRRDLNQLLPFLRSLFRQTYQQFIQHPDTHINTYKAIPTMTFKWRGREYKLCGGITKMMCAGTFLLSYYTYANTSDLFQLKQPANASSKLGEEWYTMPAFKRRAFKTIQVEMGSHELEIPKYAMTFFDNLLNASRTLSSDEDATLLQTVASKKVTVMKAPILQCFLKMWMGKHFKFTDQTGRNLRPVISRFRETGSQLTTYHQGDIVNNVMLNNTPRTRKRHYSKGNVLANNGMLQDAMSIREEQVKSRVSVKQAQINLAIKVLVIEEERKVNLPNLSRTTNGGSCTSPFGDKSEKYTKRAKKQGLAREGEALACANLLECFGCPSQVIVQSLSDIWCLLSFKACIEESIYVHLDANHYRKNFEDIVSFIELNILPNINNRLLKQAEKKLDNEGPHPFWDDRDSILGLIPTLANEA
ncbi:hypothetical protein [Vibrio cholerae]|uniref:hypothetical protein n=1 Tax=Vibrio cholerae TaxID=666 RepID=UPI0018F07A60|nr:hypothetical protein [Vibrio cholerae]EGR3963257.1 hypothetical protein [Vibrio cholerae]MBJ6940797.1 hypothetical protein [Vibrio cholerae]